MAKRKKIKKQETQMERLIHHISNPIHLSNCQYRSTITKNKKKYNRKQKHKNKNPENYSPGYFFIQYFLVLIYDYNIHLQ